MKIADNLILEQIEMGPMGNFVYLIGDANTKEIAVVDLSGEIERLISIIEDANYKVVSLLITHSHFDHISGIKEFLLKYNVPTYASKYESKNFKLNIKNIILTDNDQKIKIGNIEIKCILCPGHSAGGQSFLCENILLTGDTLFIDGCGRCDLPDSNPDKMYDTLYNKLMKLPDNTIIYPGHDYGPTTFDTMGNQKKTNPFLTCKDKTEFLEERMGI